MHFKYTPVYRVPHSYLLPRYILNPWAFMGTLQCYRGRPELALSEISLKLSNHSKEELGRRGFRLHLLTKLPPPATSALPALWDIPQLRGQPCVYPRPQPLCHTLLQDHADQGISTGNGCDKGQENTSKYRFQGNKTIPTALKCPQNQLGTPLKAKVFRVSRLSDPSVCQCHMTLVTVVLFLSPKSQHLSWLSSKRTW